MAKKRRKQLSATGGDIGFEPWIGPPPGASPRTPIRGDRRDLVGPGGAPFVPGQPIVQGAPVGDPVWGPGGIWGQPPGGNFAPRPEQLPVARAPSEPDPWQAVPGSVQPMRSFFDVGSQQRDGIITFTDMAGNVIGAPGQPGDPVTVGGPISQRGGPAQVAGGQAGQPPVQESLWGTDFDQFQQQWFDKIMAPAQNVLAARGMGAAGGSEFQHATARAGAESALIAWQARVEDRKVALAERTQRQGERISWAQLDQQRQQLRQSYSMFIKELDYNSYWRYVGGMVDLGSSMAPDVRDWGPPAAAAQRAVRGR